MKQLLKIIFIYYKCGITDSILLRRINMYSRQHYYTVSNSSVCLCWRYSRY